MHFGEGTSVEYFFYCDITKIKWENSLLYFVPM